MSRADDIWGSIDRQRRAAAKRRQAEALARQRADAANKEAQQLNAQAEAQAKVQAEAKAKVQAEANAKMAADQDQSSLMLKRKKGGPKRNIMTSPLGLSNTANIVRQTLGGM
jgi:membrane protein involved in colicin uptake